MNKLEQAARALLAKWDAHPYTPWREVGFISGDVANLREALAEPVRKCDGLLCNDCGEYKQRYKDLPGLTEKDLCVCSLAEQAEQEPVLCVECGKPTMHIGNKCYACCQKDTKDLEDALKSWDAAPVQQAEQEPFKMICPRCKVDRVTTPCPRGGVSDCPMTATAQNAAPVKTICYQEVYDALEAQLIKEPTGNGLDQLAQNNGLVMAMNTIQKMNLAEQAEQEIIPSWEEYCECEGIPCEPVKPVDLTDDEIYEVCKDVPFVVIGPDYDLAIARAVIAKFKEKNK